MTKFDFKQWVVNNKAKNRALNEQNPPPMVICGTVTGYTCRQFKECISNVLGPTQVIADSGGSNPNDFYISLGSPSPGATVLDNNGRKWKYINDQGGALAVTPYAGFPYASSATPACCGPQGCPDPNAINGSVSNTCGCNGISGPSSTGCCQYQVQGYTECINCCCRSRMQAKVANPGGGDREFEREAMGENINPTIDAISELITLAEQRRRDAKPADRRKPMDKLDPRDIDVEPIDVEPTMKEPEDEFSSTLTNTGGDPAPMGPCDAGHYEIGGPPWVLQNTFDPDIANLDPQTGICPCDNSDPNNPFGGVSLANVMNPSPQTLDANGVAVGSSAPCP